MTTTNGIGNTASSRMLNEFFPNPYEAAFHEVLDHPYEAARKDGDGRALFTRDGTALLAMTQDGEVVEVERAIEGEDWSDFGPGEPDRASRLSCRS